ncbi:MAG: TonB family protein [Chitinivibrionales bacterium]|nr:TonB family protein [Chitinivibrionales bacterium]
MNVKQTGIFYAKSSGTSAALKSFPNQFRGRLLGGLDKRFLIILLVTALVLCGFFGYMSAREVPREATEKDILKIQERYARLVLDQPKSKPQEVEEEAAQTAESEAEATRQQEEEDKPQLDREKESFAEKQERKAASAEQRRAKRREVASQVQSTGIFAAITASDGSGGGRSSGISDLLGATGGVSDLSGISVSKGTFATKNVDPEELTKKRGTRTSGVGIQKQELGKARSDRIASTGGDVVMSSNPPEVKSESGAAVTSQACIGKVVNRQKPRIKRVYENWLKRDPGLSGSLKIKFTILPSGAVSNVSIVKSTMNNSKFEQNLLRYVRRWKFGSCQISEPTEVVYPFAFEGNS